MGGSGEMSASDGGGGWDNGGGIAGGSWRNNTGCTSLLSSSISFSSSSSTATSSNACTCGWRVMYAQVAQMECQRSRKKRTKNTLRITPPVVGTAFSVDDTDVRREGGRDGCFGDDEEGRRRPKGTGTSTEATAGDDRERLRVHVPGDAVPGNGTRKDFVDHVLTRGRASR